MRLIDADAFKVFWNKEFRMLYPNDKYLVALSNFPTIDPESLRPKWISVEDRLPQFSPKKWRKVLVTIEDESGKRFVSTAKYHEFWEYWYEFTSSRYCDSDKFRVVAWMERPAPYGVDMRGDTEGGKI